MNAPKRLSIQALLALAMAAPGAVFAAWEADPGHTLVSFEIGHMGLSAQQGLFRKAEVRLNYDDQNLQSSSVTVSIEAASVDTVNAARDAIIRGADWLDVERSPTITFVSRSVRRVDDRSIAIAGDLTIRGKTLPVEFSARVSNRISHPMFKVPAIGFAATARIKRSDFGLTKLLAPVADDVDLQIRLELIQKS